MIAWSKDFNLKHRSDCIYLRPFFDIHAGTSDCDIEMFKRDVQWVKDTPNAYAYLGGDMCDFINTSDKRFDPQTIALTHLKKLDNLAMSQCNEIIDILMPIKHKLLFMLEGNHEDSIKRHYHLDVAAYISCRLEIPNLSDIAFVRLTFKRSGRASRSLKLFTAHGFGSAATYAGKIKRIMDLMLWADADVYICGHVHSKGFSENVKLSITRQDEPRIIDNNRIAIIAGTYLKVYSKHSTYGSRKGYAPGPLGCTTLKITPFGGCHKVNKVTHEGPLEVEIVNKTNMRDINVDAYLVD
jgi:hypothetical protein